MSKSDPYLEVPAGQAVFREGDAGQTMFVIEAGTVDIHITARGSTPVASLGPGDFFGEMAMLEDEPRIASAIVRESARLLCIERASFADLLRQNIEIAVRIMRKLSARHRRSESRLAEALAETARLRSVASVAQEPSRPPKAREPIVASAPAPAPAPDPAPAPAARPPAASPAAAVAPAAAVVPRAEPPPVARSQPMCILRHAGGTSYPLDPALSHFLVGRPDPVADIHPEIDLSAVDATRSLSRRHAKLVREGRLLFVREEVGTVNGTFVNGVRVKTGVDVAIKPGDTLRFGAVEVQLAAA